MYHELLKLAFHPNLVLRQPVATSIQLSQHTQRVTLKHLSAGIAAALDQLAAGQHHASNAASEQQLHDLVLQHDGKPGLARWLYYLQRLHQKNMLCYVLCTHDNPLLTIVPCAPPDIATLPAVPAAQACILSRFALCRREGEHLVLESPLAHAYFVLHEAEHNTVPTRHAWLHHLSTPTSLHDLTRALPDMEEQTLNLLLRVLLHYQLITPINEEGKNAEENNPALTQWEFHDLLFHTRSRSGRHCNPIGTTYRFQENIAPLPAMKPTTTGESYPLYRPDIEYLKANDLPLTKVLEERASLREQGAEPITLEQLGELLYRSARMRQLNQPDQHLPYETSQRLYPGGGACYELEIYLAVDRCQHLPSGLYHYHPLHHSLETISNRSPAVEQLLRDAGAALGQAEFPQVLIILSARFQRVSWKYDSLAYALILKDSGVLLQTMELVANAMGLAWCILGCGNADLFAQAANTEYYSETSVAECVVGSARALHQ